MRGPLSAKQVDDCQRYHAVNTTHRDSMTLRLATEWLALTAERDRLATENRAMRTGLEAIINDLNEVNSGIRSFVRKRCHDMLKRTPEPTGQEGICQTCKLADPTSTTPGTRRIDNGLDAGVHCDACNEKMVQECRSKSW